MNDHGGYHGWYRRFPQSPDHKLLMNSIRCPSCNAKLRLPEGFSGGVIKCPKCGVQFNPVAASDPIEDVTAPDPGPKPQEDETTSTNVAGVARRLAGRAKDAPSRLDFNFNKFWTPAIIKVSWVGVVGLSLLWLLFLAFFYVGTMFSDGGGSPTSFLTGQKMDLQEVLSGKGDVAGLNKMLDDLTGVQGGEASGAVPEKTTYQKISSFAFKSLMLLTTIFSLVITVLWCRVFFETIIVIFEIASRLKSIDEKT